MITTNKKFIECDYRIRFGIHDCTECDISFECEEHDNSFIEPHQEEFDLFKTVATYFMPAIHKLPC
jgi:hypothetical protein